MIPGAFLFTALLAIIWINAPRCYTCGKRKAQMHFTDKLDCLKCYVKKDGAKP